MTAKEKKNYLNNKDLLKEIENYHIKGVVSKNLHNMFYTLAKKIAMTPLFTRKIYDLTRQNNDMSCYDEMIDSGYLKCLLKIDKFNIANKNPFAYFTTIVFNAFRDYFYFEKKFEIMKNISQKEYEQRFLFKYGFYPVKNNLDTEE